MIFKHFMDVTFVLGNKLCLALVRVHLRGRPYMKDVRTRRGKGVWGNKRVMLRTTIKATATPYGVVNRPMLGKHVAILAPTWVPTWSHDG